MRIVSSASAGMRRLAKHPPQELHPDIKRRRRVLEWYAAHGRNASLTCRHFGLSRETFHRWKRRYDPHQPQTLANRSCRPKRCPRPTWTREQREAVVAVREAYGWGKDKIAAFLAEDRGMTLSVSMVGRILSRVKATGELKEPPRTGISAKKRRIFRPHAIRKPKDYQVTEPGDLVQVDTLDVRPVPGVVLKHYSAVDVVSRRAVFTLRGVATSHTAAEFLSELAVRLPFPVKAIQVDNGSEFMAEFEAVCDAKGWRQFLLPPRSPKLNGRVERIQRTVTEEFYERSTADPTVAALGKELAEFERLYNEVRPHQALGQKPPARYLAERGWETTNQKEVSRRS